jgi:hypothetical protein
MEAIDQVKPVINDPTDTQINDEELVQVLDEIEKDL